MSLSPSLHTEDMSGPYNDVLPSPTQSPEDISNKPTQPSDVREGLMDNLRAAKAAQHAIGIALTEKGVSDIAKEQAYRAAGRAVDAADLAIYALHGVRRADNRPEPYEE